MSAQPGFQLRASVVKRPRRERGFLRALNEQGTRDRKRRRTLARQCAARTLGTERQRAHMELASVRVSEPFVTRLNLPLWTYGAFVCLGTQHRFRFAASVRATGIALFGS